MPTSVSPSLPVCQLRNCRGPLRRSGSVFSVLQGLFASEFQQDHRTCAGLEIMGLGSCDVRAERCKTRRLKSGDYNNKCSET